MAKVVIVGGGFAGCAAAVAAAKSGAAVILLERMDVLGGLGLIAGAVNYKNFPGQEELRLMGGDEIFQVIENCALHQKVEFPWPEPDGTLNLSYDVSKLDPELRKSIQGMGIQTKVLSRVRDVEKEHGTIRAVILDDGTKVEGDVFVDATGGSGSTANCRKYGNGCVFCVMRCLSFGDRVSISAKAGMKELIGKKADGSFGPMSAAYCLLKESLAPHIRQELEQRGCVFVPVPEGILRKKTADQSTSHGHINRGFVENVVLVDIGAYAKRHSAPYMPLEELHTVPGLERATYAIPLAGSVGNSVRFMALTPRDNSLKVPGVDNLFVAGEKLGTNGIGEAVASGVIAGHNAVRAIKELRPLVLPETTILGDFFSYVNQRWNQEEGLRTRFQLSGGSFFSRALEKHLYTEDRKAILLRIQSEGLVDVFSNLIA